MNPITTRLLMEMAVNKALKEISRGNLPRLFKRLAGSEEQLASLGCPQELMPLARSMLKDDQHPYYTLVRKAAEEIDHRYFTGFLLNLIDESLRGSGELLRVKHSQTGCRIPWILGIRTPLPAPEVLHTTVLLGVCTYLLFLPDASSAAGLLALCRAHPHIAFAALIPDREVSEALLHELDSTPNLAILPVVRGLHSDSSPLLAARRRLYCPVFVPDCHETVQLLEAGDTATKDDPASPLSAFVPGPDVPLETAALLASLIFHRRMEPVHPAVSVFPPADLLSLQQIITGRPGTDFSLPGDVDSSAFILPGEEMITLIQSMA